MTDGESSRQRSVVVSRPTRVETRPKSSRLWSLLNKRHKRTNIHNFNNSNSNSNNSNNNNSNHNHHAHTPRRNWEPARVSQTQDTIDWPAMALGA